MTTENVIANTKKLTEILNEIVEILKTRIAKESVADTSVSLIEILEDLKIFVRITQIATTRGKIASTTTTMGTVGSIASTMSTMTTVMNPLQAYFVQEKSDLTLENNEPFIGGYCYFA
jgi:mannitol-specific phosphotransferase system IIBC component